MASRSEPLLSIIVVTWNAKKYVLACLQSLRASLVNIHSEVIVVDNSSSDGTPDAVRRQFSEVKLIENKSNLGFAKANNIGLAASRGKYLCLVNSDVVVPPGCFENILAFMETTPHIGVLGPKMLSPLGGVGASVRRLPTVWNTLCCALGLHLVFPKSKLFGGYLMASYPYNATDDVETVSGWFLVISRWALLDVGGLDDQFFMYGEDIDWCHRFRESGWRVVFYSGAAALHYGAGSSRQAPTRFHIEKHKANLQYFRKHHHRFDVACYQLVIGLHELIRVIAYSLVYCVSTDRRADAALKITRSSAGIRWLLRNGLFSVKPATDSPYVTKQPI
jgi:GT2 family glycosyltransferase